MKKLLFVLLGFALFPMVSSAQVISHTMEDSVLTIFINPLKNQPKMDTIYPTGEPNKINFVFTNITSKDYVSEAVLVRGKRAIDRYTSETDSLTFFPARMRWDGDFIVTVLYVQKGNSLDTLVNNVCVTPPNLLKKMQLPPMQRDSVERLENHIERVEYSRTEFEQLKQPQQNLTKKDKKKIAKIYKKLRLGVPLDSNKFIDVREATNMDYIDYLTDTKGEYLRLLPLIDSSAWYKLYGDSIFDKNYLPYFVYGNYPIVGVTYEQAQAYCIWRGNMVSQYINEKQKRKYKDYEVMVRFRLPTEEEWEYVAIKDDLNKQFGGYSSKRHYTEKEKRKIYRSAKNYVDSTRTLEEVKSDIKNYFESDTSYKRMFNYEEEYKTPYFIKEETIFPQLKTNWVYLYEPTTHLYLYNIFGNVAEMTSEKGIAKGGSFAHTLEECAADRVQKYDAPKAWLGFRCVAEVVVRKKEN